MPALLWEGRLAGSRFESHLDVVEEDVIREAEHRISFAKEFQDEDPVPPQLRLCLSSAARCCRLQYIPALLWESRLGQYICASALSSSGYFVDVANAVLLMWACFVVFCRP